MGGQGGMLSRPRLAQGGDAWSKWAAKACHTSSPHSKSGPVTGPHDVADPLQVRVRQAGAARQTQTASEEVLRHGAPTSAAAGEHGLQVERLPDRPRLDVDGLQRQADVLAARPERLR